METNLRIPGPTPLPPSVREALSRPMVNHRGPEFKAFFKGLLADLKRVFQTDGDVLILPASGTGGMEAAIVNAIGPGERVLAVTTGFFGDRFADIAEVSGADVERLSFPWGAAVDPDAVRDALRARPGTRAVLVTHNETSTGVTNDLQAIASAVHSVGDGAPLLIVDAVSSLAAIDVQTDAWGCDMVVTCSQKALMAPPGLAIVSVGPRAWDTINGQKCRSYYFDLRSAAKRAKEGETPATPPVSDLFGMREGVNLILTEGLANVFARHKAIGEHTRQGIEELGLELLPARRDASDTVTAVRSPDADGLRARMRDQGVVLAGGQGQLKGQICRIGHLGYVSMQDIDRVMSALKQSL